MENILKFEEHISELIAAKRFNDLRQLMIDKEPADIGEALGELTPEEYIIAYRLLPKDLASDVFVEMDHDSQMTLINRFSEGEVKEIMNNLYADDAADILDEMPASVVRKLLDNTSPDMRSALNELLKYPDNSAGSIMTTEYVHLKKDMTADQAIAYIRQVALDSETVYNCYITENRKLLGVISIREILTMKPEQTIGEIMETQVVCVKTSDDREDASALFNRYGYVALPVVDTETRLVGIITVDDAIAVMAEETEEDFAKMAAITPTDKPYLKTSPFRIWLTRIPWLLLLMVSATFTGMIISGFESALSKFVALTAFIPMLMDTGGNSGSQASVTVIRGLSTGEVELRDVLKVVWKEFRVSVLCGVTLSAAAFVKIILVDNLIMHSNVSLTVALVVCLTLCVTVLAAKLIGCSLPILGKRLGFDPAVMASPFITTIVDAVSLLVYFAIAKSFLPI